MLDSIGKCSQRARVRGNSHVVEDTRETLKAETGVESSLKKQDIIEYTKDVLREINTGQSVSLRLRKVRQFTFRLEIINFSLPHGAFKFRGFSPALVNELSSQMNFRNTNHIA